MVKIGLKKVLFYLVVIVLSAVWLLPLVWTFVVAFKENRSQDVYRLSKWFQLPYTFENFKNVMTNGQANIFGWLFNSFVVTIISTCGVVFLSILAAYAFSKFKFPGQIIWFWIVMAGMMVPFESILIPEYILFREWGLLNTRLCLILPALGSSMGVLMLKQFIDGLPKSLFEAAEIDGCSSLRTLFTIVLPLIKVAVSSLIIFIFLQRWNDFLWPYIAVTKSEVMMIPTGIILFQSQHLEGYGQQMAANAMAITPTIIVYLIFQKNIVKGIALSGMKE